jgi:hypothetical protein
VLFESIQMRRPELPIGGEPFIELRERLRANAIQTALGVRAGVDQAGLLEDPQVLGHRWLAEAEEIDKLSDGSLSSQEVVDDREPTGFAQDLERRQDRHDSEYAN